MAEEDNCMILCKVERQIPCVKSDQAAAIASTFIRLQASYLLELQERHHYQGVLEVCQPLDRLADLWIEMRS